MWGLAIYDCRTGLLLLSRDRFGEKPLYIYTENNGDVYFGSEPKFIFALKGHSLAVNMNQVRRYLVNGYKSLYKGDDTFFEGLVALRPGTHLTLNDHKEAAPESYWQPSLSQNEYSELSFDDAVGGVKDRLTKSVKSRLQSDVPVAFCLSGGIDSNALAAIARKSSATMSQDFQSQIPIRGIVKMNSFKRQLMIWALNITKLRLRLKQVISLMS